MTIRIASFSLLIITLLVGCLYATPPSEATQKSSAGDESGLSTLDEGQPEGIPETIVDNNTLTIFVEPDITHQTIKDVTRGNFIDVFSGTTEPIERSAYTTWRIWI